MKTRNSPDEDKMKLMLGEVNSRHRSWVRLSSRCFRFSQFVLHLVKLIMLMSKLPKSSFDDSNMFSFVDTIMAAIESDTKTKQFSRTFMGHMSALFEFITFKNGQLLTMLINFFHVDDLRVHQCISLDLDQC